MNIGKNILLDISPKNISIYRDTFSLDYIKKNSLFSTIYPLDIGIDSSSLDNRFIGYVDSFVSVWVDRFGEVL